MKRTEGPTGVGAHEGPGSLVGLGVGSGGGRATTTCTNGYSPRTCHGGLGNQEWTGSARGGVEVGIRGERETGVRAWGKRSI